MKRPSALPEDLYWENGTRQKERWARRDRARERRRYGLRRGRAWQDVRNSIARRAKEHGER